MRNHHVTHVALIGLATWSLLIPSHCIEPLLRLYEATTPWALQQPFEELVSSGYLDLGGCTVGFDGMTDIQVPPKAALEAFNRAYRKDQTRATLTGWLNAFLRQGCVEIYDQGRVCREGYS